MRIYLKYGWIEVEEIISGVFIITRNSFTQGADPDLGFSQWDEEVTNLDTESDTFRVLEISCHLKWQNVELDLSDNPLVIYSPSIELLDKAIKHVTMRAFDGWDV